MDILEFLKLRSKFIELLYKRLQILINGASTFNAGIRSFQVRVELLGTHVEGVDLFVGQCDLAVDLARAVSVHGRRDVTLAAQAVAVVSFVAPAQLHEAVVRDTHDDDVAG